MKCEKFILNRYDKGIEEYLIDFESLVRSHYIERIEQGTFPASKGGLLGTARAISEFDNLNIITALYNAAYDADIYYSDECYDWS